MYFLFTLNSKAEENNIKQYSSDEGVLSIMYHRFDENKYPSTNIRMEIFLKQIQLIKDLNYEFIHPEEFQKNFDIPKKQKKILLTIDDAFQSFYEVAWPYLKKNKIPFILFVSTREVGKKGYMSWDNIREIEKYDFVEIGNHSHTHEYLIDYTDAEIEKDLKMSINIFKENLKNEFKLEVIESNEDFTSQIISSEFKNKEYDSLSAQKIFESWVNTKNE